MNELLTGEAPFSGKHVADVGCGSGELVRWLAGQGARVIGLDVAEILSRAESFPRVGNETYRVVFGAGLPLDENWADLVLYMASLHHVPKGAYVSALEECRRVLKPSARALIVEPVQEAGAYGEVTRLAGDETEAQRSAYEAIRKVSGMSMEREEQFYFERSFTDFCLLLESSVPDASRREKITEQARAITVRLALGEGVHFSDFRYRSVCRLNVLKKAGAGVRSQL